MAMNAQHMKQMEWSRLGMRRLIPSRVSSLPHSSHGPSHRLCPTCSWLQGWGPCQTGWPALCTAPGRSTYTDSSSLVTGQLTWFFFQRILFGRKCSGGEEMLLPQGGPGLKVPVGGGVGVEWGWSHGQDLPTSYLESLAKVLSTPVLRPCRPGWGWGFLPSRQLWTMGVTSGLPVDLGPGPVSVS